VATGHCGRQNLPAKFSAAKFRQTKKEDGVLPEDHFGVYKTIEALQALRDAPPAKWPAVYDHAADWICAEITRRKLQRGEFDFHDLLQRLHYALTQPGSGLPALIRQQYPVALVDEFQDTDALQYGALHQIYLAGRAERPDDTSALVMIGDPKQAIYRFRGADLGIYLQARRRQRTRSIRSVATSVHPNRWSMRSTTSSPGQSGPSAISPMSRSPPRRPTASTPVPRPDGSRWPALTVWTAADMDECKATVLSNEFAQGMATQIVTLLNEGQVRARRGCSPRAHRQRSPSHTQSAAGAQSPDGVPV
jgi:exodeoxyribonuclease V beta subunit